LGIDASFVEVDDFERNGKTTPKLMALFLSYIYNHDLLSESPSLPYFIMALVPDKTGTFQMMEDCNEKLRTRRRKMDHGLITIVALIVNRWAACVFSIVSKRMVLIDLQWTKETPEPFLK
jgi:hypothetical protein